MFKMFLQFLCVLGICTSCHRPVIGQSQDVIMVDSIRKQSNFAFAQSGLVRVGGGDAYNPELGTIRETYQTRKMRFQTIEQARAYFIKVFSEYIAHFNADARLGQFVKGHPFSSTNTEIQITILDEHGGPPGAPQIARLRNNQDKLIIYTFDKNEQRYIEITQEPLY